MCGGVAVQAGCRNAAPVMQRVPGQACASMPAGQDQLPPASIPAALGHGVAGFGACPLPVVSPFCSLLCSSPAWQNLPHDYRNGRGAAVPPECPAPCWDGGAREEPTHRFFGSASWFSPWCDCSFLSQIKDILVRLGPPPRPQDAARGQAAFPFLPPTTAKFITPVASPGWLHPDGAGATASAPQPPSLPTPSPRMVPAW